MPPGPVSCIGGTKYPHCIVPYCIKSRSRYVHAAECCTRYAHDTHTCRSVGCTRDTGSTDDSVPSHC